MHHGSHNPPNISCPHNNPSSQTQTSSQTRPPSETSPIGGPSSTQVPSPGSSGECLPRGLDDSVIALPPAANRAEQPHNPASRFRYHRRKRPKPGEMPFGNSNGGSVYGSLRPQAIVRRHGWSNEDEQMKRKGEDGEGDKVGIGRVQREVDREDESLRGNDKTRQQPFEQQQKEHLNWRQGLQQQRVESHSPRHPYSGLRYPFHLQKTAQGMQAMPPIQSPLSRANSNWTWGQPQDTPNS